MRCDLVFGFFNAPQAILICSKDWEPPHQTGWSQFLYDCVTLLLKCHIPSLYKQSKFSNKTSKVFQIRLFVIILASPLILLHLHYFLAFTTQALPLSDYISLWLQDNIMREKINLAHHNFGDFIYHLEAKLISPLPGRKFLLRFYS